MPITPSISASIDQVTLKVNSQGQAYVDTANIIDGNTITATSNKAGVNANPPFNTTSGIGLNVNYPLNNSKGILNLATLSNITISADETLVTDLHANDLTIDSGITLTTNGFHVYCTGTLTNNGTISTGQQSTPQAWTSSYGGSGGGAGNNSAGGAGSPGSISTALPAITATLISTWQADGFQTYMAGAGGGASNVSSASPGGWGVYIQAVSIINNGTISSTGAVGGSNPDVTFSGNAGFATLVAGGASPAAASSYGGWSGCAGSGVIILAYQTSLTLGTINVTGVVSGGAGGAGGAGQYGTYQYTTPPIPVPISVFNRAYLQNLTAQTTTSTTAVNIGAINIISQNSGNIIVDLCIRGSNNTLGDGIAITLLNGTTILDTETYTQEGLAGNEHTFTLHYELPSTQGQIFALNCEINAITGGTASAKIKQFSAWEATIT